MMIDHVGGNLYCACRTEENKNTLILQARDQEVFETPDPSVEELQKFQVVYIPTSS